MSVAKGIHAEAEGMVSVCSLRAGEGLFGIDTRMIREVLGKTTTQVVPLAPGFVAGVVPYRGDVLTTVSLRSLLGMERCREQSQILVLDDDEEQGLFGLMVDSVGGVVTMGAGTLQANPAALDIRSMALFDGVYWMETGLMVRLDPRRLRPRQLEQCGLFESPRILGHGEPR